MQRFLDADNLGRDCPSWDELRTLFRREETRRQRHSDGTVSVAGKRFEIPARYRMLRDVTVRFASWDLTKIALVDRHRGHHLADLYPVDKARNADKRRSALEVTDDEPVTETGIAPLLASQMEADERNGLGPAYMPIDESDDLEDIF